MCVGLLAFIQLPFKQGSTFMASKTNYASICMHDSHFALFGSLYTREGKNGGSCICFWNKVIIGTQALSLVVYLVVEYSCSLIIGNVLMCK